MSWMAILTCVLSSGWHWEQLVRGRDIPPVRNVLLFILSPEYFYLKHFMSFSSDLVEHIPSFSVAFLMSLCLTPYF